MVALVVGTLGGWESVVMSMFSKGVPRLRMAHDGSDMLCR